MADLRNVKNPVVFFANGVGDHLLSIPAVRALGDLFSGRLTLVCAEGAHAIFYSDVPFQKVIEVPVRRTATSRGVFDARKLAEQLRPCDLLISLNPWHSKSVDQLVRTLSPKISIGFGSAFGIAVPHNYAKHAADMTFDIPKHIEPSLKLEDYCAPPTLPPDCKLSASRIRNRIAKSVNVLAVHADTSLEKRWPLPKFRRILNLFLERNKNFLGIDVGLKNLNLDKGYNNDRMIPACALPLGVAFGVIAEADLFLGFDSCMLHAADLFRVPGVGLFRTTSVTEWGFRLGPGRCFSSKNPESIADAEVIEGLESLIQ